MIMVLIVFQLANRETTGAMWYRTIYQWEFQGLKREVLYHIELKFGDIPAYIALTNNTVGTSNLGT